MTSHHCPWVCVCVSVCVISMYVYGLHGAWQAAGDYNLFSRQDTDGGVNSLVVLKKYDYGNHMFTLINEYSSRAAHASLTSSEGTHLCGCERKGKRCGTVKAWKLLDWEAMKVLKVFHHSVEMICPTEVAPFPPNQPLSFDNTKLLVTTQHKLQMETLNFTMRNELWISREFIPLFKNHSMF